MAARTSEARNGPPAPGGTDANTCCKPLRPRWHSRLSASFAQAEIKIGAVLSVTGPASFLGDPEKKTLEMYVADINAKGGVNGQQVKLFVYDDGGDAEPGAHLRHAPDRSRTRSTRCSPAPPPATTMAIIPLAEEAQACR